MSSQTLRKITDEYVNFHVDGKRVHLPYVLSSTRWRYWHSSGKGTPAQLQQEIRNLLKRKNKTITELDSYQLTKLLRKERIGIECSGFVYQVLKRYVQEEYGKNISYCLKRFPGVVGALERRLLAYKRSRRISAAVLTSDRNTINVAKVTDIVPGDLIRLTPRRWKGKHVALVVEITQEEITYAHSSRDTTRLGPHYGKIKITHPEGDLDQQEWQELTKDGKNYGVIAYRKAKGDSVRRLKCLV